MARENRLGMDELNESLAELLKVLVELRQEMKANVDTLEQVITSVHEKI